MTTSYLPFVLTSNFKLAIFTVCLMLINSPGHAQPCTVTAGVLSTTSPTSNLCLNDGDLHPVQLTISGNTGIGRFGLVEASTGNIVATNTSGFFEMTNYGPGVYNAGHISVLQASTLVGVTNTSQLMGCYKLSNGISISSIWVDGGTITATGPTNIEGGTLAFQVTGASGPNRRWALLNNPGTQVLAVQTNGTFNFDGYENGTYRVAHAAFGPSIALGNIDPQNLEGCISKSNVLTVVKLLPFDCPALSANVGDPCNDGNPGTSGDVVTEACTCEGTNPCGELPPGTICNPATTRIWMDRNLGASQVATSKTDQAAYGDLYQWGRGTDGHQVRTSSTTAVLSNSDQPVNGLFIQSVSIPYDWRSPQNNSLWQGASGTNNPCPDGFRIPTQTEWNEERASWNSNNNNGAFNSPLKLTQSGYRSLGGGLTFFGTQTYYWSSTVSGTGTLAFGINNFETEFTEFGRAAGISVRCIKDYDCPDLDGNVGDACDDGNPATADDTVTEACQCVGTYDCPGQQANFGDACDDGNPETVNDVVNETCECAGIVYDCPVLGSNVGDACDDGNPVTVGDVVTETCECAGMVPPPAPVINPATGRTWMDRNLGASQVATSQTDAAAYGDLYQWGRGADGHQIRTSPTTTTKSSGDQPGNGNFILSPDFPWDWRVTQNNNLWQGVDGINNPCPEGFRVPTEAEWIAERLTWSSSNAAGAFASPLKLTPAGFRFYAGEIVSAGSLGYYSSSTVFGLQFRRLFFDSGTSNVGTGYRVLGYSVRCIMD